MIKIGLTSFSEHETLTGKKRATLYDYASYLPLVEMDTAYYAIPKKESVKKWVEEVPDDFRFVMKVYSGISLQNDWHSYYQSETEMIETFLDVMNPMIDSGKLFAFLIQFSGTFGCTKENVQYLKKIRHWFSNLPVAIELRNGSWYSEKYYQQTLQFMRQQQFSFVMVDEPQVPTNTVPFSCDVTNQQFALFRFHGRNSIGWMANDKDWRKKRTLYRYSKNEIAQLCQDVLHVSKKVKETGVIFNNNSGGDAADNALEMKEQLGIEYENLHPKQLGLF